MLSEKDLKVVKKYMENISPKPKSVSYQEHIWKEEKVDLSIILPCYNVEDYLEECIQSILEQKTKYKWELICINDGSTDNTASILANYKEQENIFIIEQTNKGFSGARNAGLLQVTGKYIMFIDSDDVLCENAIEVLMDIAEENKADIVEGKWKVFAQCTDYEDSTEIVAFETNEKEVSGYVWGKVINKKVMEKIMFPEGYWYEDSIMRYLIVPQCKKIMKTNKMVYLYRKNINGITSKAGYSNKCIDTYWITELMLEEMKRMKIEMNQQIYEMLLDQIALNSIRVEKMQNQTKVAVFYLTEDLMKGLVDTYNTSLKFQKILEKALKTGDYPLYRDGCKIVWEANRLGIN